MRIPLAILFELLACRLWPGTAIDGDEMNLNLFKQVNHRHLNGAWEQWDAFIRKNPKELKLQALIEVFRSGCDGWDGIICVCTGIHDGATRRPIAHDLFSVFCIWRNLT
jgi:hypothetical protein